MKCLKTFKGDKVEPGRRAAKSTRDGERGGFTLVEFLVALLIIGLILACVIPYVMAIREASNRQVCAGNLRVIRAAFFNYHKDYGSYPRTRADVTSRTWECYTGADAPDPFADRSDVRVNDVTASLWWLVHTGYVTDTNYFICPSTSDYADPLTDGYGRHVAAERRGNFRSKRNLSYSLLSPFNPSPPFEWKDTFPAQCALMADRNPGVAGKKDDVTRPASSDAPAEQVYANSNNHSKAGQNVLFADGSVMFERTAFCGSGYQRFRPKFENEPELPLIPGDNIYTALRAAAPDSERKAAEDGPGDFGGNIPPTWQYDSYLLPSDDQ